LIDSSLSTEVEYFGRAPARSYEILVPPGKKAEADDTTIVGSLGFDSTSLELGIWLDASTSLSVSPTLGFETKPTERETRELPGNTAEADDTEATLVGYLTSVLTFGRNPLYLDSLMRLGTSTFDESPSSDSRLEDLGFETPNDRETLSLSGLL